MGDLIGVGVWGFGGLGGGGGVKLLMGGAQAKTEGPGPPCDVSGGDGDRGGSC